MRSTIELFRHLYSNIPPLFPPSARERWDMAIARAEQNDPPTLSELEDVIIGFGYELWSWRQAYRYFFDYFTTELGSHFLLPKLLEPLQHKYGDFIHYGGSFSQTRSGNAAGFFTDDERLSLIPALSATGQELRLFTDNEVLGSSRSRYLNKVREYEGSLAEIKRHLRELRALAAMETDFPALVMDIAAQVRAFEEGLCLLAPEIDREELARAPEYFRERRAHLIRQQNLPAPVAIDFYATVI